jgi:uncharacterized protein (TIRG00374 family)
MFRSGIKRYLIKWAVSIALIFFALRAVEIDSVFSALKSVELSLYAMVIFTAWCIQLATTAKWRLLNSTLDFWQMFRTNIVSHYYAFLVPSSLTGDVARVLKLEGANQNRDLHAAVVIVDRLTGLLAAFLLLAVLAPLYSSRHEIMGHYIGAISITGFALMATLSFLYTLPLGRKARLSTIQLFRRQTHLPKYFAQAAKMVVISGRLMKWHLISKSIVSGVGIQLMTAAYQYMLFTAFSVQISFIDSVVVTVLSQLASTIPLGIAGIGPRDLSIVGFATASGALKSNVVASLVAGYPVILMIVLCGLWLDAKVDAVKLK